MDFILLLMIPFWSFDLELLPVLPSRLNNLLLWGFLFWLLALLLAAPLSSHRSGDRKTCCGRAGSRDPQPGLSWSSDSVVSHRQWERSSTFPSPNPEHRSLLSHPSSRSCQTFIKAWQGFGTPAKHHNLRLPEEANKVKGGYGGWNGGRYIPGEPSSSLPHLSASPPSRPRSSLRSLAKPAEGMRKRWLQIEMNILLKRIQSAW